MKQDLEKFNKPYDPKEVEQKIYKIWEESGCFNPDNLPAAKQAKKLTKLKAKSFCIIMPPPNANGSLHLGHAVFVALQDIMIRYHRMKGEKTLWLPGADHAGFETQVVYDKKLEKEGRSRFQIPRDQLYKEMMEFTLANKKGMESQLRRLGASCDWSREKFTLDGDIVSKTQDAFIELHKQGLVYRGERSVNWCVKHQTGLSDLEVLHEERKDPLYYIKYGPITLATVRLETKFGDTAIAVHPKDARYKKFIGKEVEITTLIGKTKIKVIADKAVDPKFGTGAVKVTPAHDPADFEIWQRHKNEIPKPPAVIDKFGRLDLLTHFSNNEKAKKYHGLKVLEARKIIAEDMQKEGLMEKVDNEYAHNVSVCYKCKHILEPRITAQWFIKTKPLADPAIEAAKSGEIKFIPDRFKKIYFHWLKNIRDWNISRQIVWGIRIPVWFCKNPAGIISNFQFLPPIAGSLCGGTISKQTSNSKPQIPNTEKFVVAKERPAECPFCGSCEMEQDPDVFDTWFSSGQWPFLALGWPDGDDFKKFYATDVMETGWDILFFWVARMIMLGIWRAKKVPFKHIYLHGLVRDKERQKMSKSKGNVIDPLGVIDLYGADALRMALVVGNTPGNDPIIYEEKIKGYRNFANKIWQASRFVLTNTQDFDDKAKPKLTASDKKRLKELKKFCKDITKQIDDFKFYAAAENLYHYFWHTFCDKIIEESKLRLNGENKADRQAAQHLLLEILKTNLKLFHPFMPHITEEIWEHIPEKKNLLMIEEWPKG